MAASYRKDERIPYYTASGFSSSTRRMKHVTRREGAKARAARGKKKGKKKGKK